MDNKRKKDPGKAFEPPPWEKQQFEEFARQRAATGSEPTEAMPELETVVPEVVPSAAAEQKKAEENEKKDEEQTEREGRIDEKQVSAMLLQLQAEDPATDPALWRIGLVLAGLSAVLGAVMTVWGVAAMFTSGDKAAGMMGGVVLLLFGGMFVGVGVWMAVRSLKQRGVL